MRDQLGCDRGWPGHLEGLSGRNRVKVWRVEMKGLCLGDGKRKGRQVGMVQESLRTPDIGKWIKSNTIIKDQNTQQGVFVERMSSL